MTLRYRAHQIDPAASQRTFAEKAETNAGLAATFAIPVGSVAQGGGWDKNLRLGGKLLGGVGVGATYAAVSPAATAKNARIARNYVSNARDHDARAGAYGMPQKLSSLSRASASTIDLLGPVHDLPMHSPDSDFLDKAASRHDVRVNALRQKVSAMVPGPSGPPSPPGGLGGSPPGPPAPLPGPNNAKAASGGAWNWLESALANRKVTREINPQTGAVDSIKVLEEAFPLRGALKTLGLLAAVPASAIGINALYRNSVKRQRARQEESAFESAMDLIENDPHFLKGDAALMQRELGDQFRPVARRGFATVNRYAPTVASDPALAAEFMTRLMPETFGGMMTGDAYLARIEQLAKMENSIQKNEPSLASPLGSLFSSLL